MPEPTRPSVSVVVCCFNGAATLGACLDALGRQSVRRDAEIVVVDDGSTDATVEIARRDGVVLVRHETNRGTSAARNTGIRASHAPVVAFTDADCVPDEKWLENLLRWYATPDVVGVGGGVGIARVETFVHRYLADNNPLAPLELDLATNSSLAYRLALYLKRMWSPEVRREARAVYAVPSANMSFRRDVLDAVGLLDERFTFGSDDEHLCASVRARFPGSVLWFDPDAVVLHDYVGTLTDTVRRNAAYGRGHARYFRLDDAQRWPTVFPFPIAVALAATRVRRGRHAVALLLAVQLTMPHGLLGAWRHRRAANLGFAYVRLAEEAAHNAGLFSGLAASASRSADPHGGPSRR